MSEQLGVILHRLDDLRQDVAELKEDTKKQNDNLVEKYISQTKKNANFDAAYLSAQQRLDNHELRLTTMERVLPELIMVRRVLTVLGGILAVTLIAFLWTILTHQVEVMFP